MKVSNSEKIKLLSFIASCDDFATGKFLLVDSKINKLLKQIGEIDCLYNLFEELLINYDFEKEFNHCQIKFIGKPARFEVPKEPNKFLPLVFCMLVQIQDGSIDFPEFLKKYYNSSSADFAKEVILPFRNMISDIFELPADASELVEEIKEEKTEEEDNMEEELNYYEKLSELVSEMISIVEYSAKIKDSVKENANLVLNAMQEALDQNSLTILNGLIVGFEYIAPQIKNIKLLYNEFKQTLLEMYED